MEDLLLVLDEIDDFFAMIAMKWHSIASLVLAVAAFIATGFVFFTAPLAAEVLALGLISWGVFERVRERRVEFASARALDN
ncbi:MAG TPA: hypothetical protein VK629_09665 [Steroidobacteraceae bacterium]|nr:hypothetical protein [Steroidobacteraceae bacterium]